MRLSSDVSSHSFRVLPQSDVMNTHFKLLFSVFVEGLKAVEKSNLLDGAYPGYYCFSVPNVDVTKSGPPPLVLDVRSIFGETHGVATYSWQLSHVPRIKIDKIIDIILGA